MLKQRKPRREEDLFKDSTMTFGEHLEELRSCLFKALIGLAVGFLVGLMVGGRAVEFIQRPLENAQAAFYVQQSADDVEARREQLQDLGYTLPEEREALEKLLAEKDLMLQEIYIRPADLLEQLRKASPESFADAPASADAEGKPFEQQLVKLPTWRSIKEHVGATSFGAHEPFVIYIKASLVVGILLASPWIFYQIWAFVAAGLYPHEKRYVHLFLPFSLGLFFAGAGLAFFFVFEPVLRFLFYFNQFLGIHQQIRISEWMGFVLILPLGFGISFQLPLVMLFLERIGIFDVQAYVSKWRIAILVIFALSMMLTPADPTSMLLMAVPLTGLYAGGIALCRYMPRNRSPFDALDEG